MGANVFFSTGIENYYMRIRKAKDAGKKIGWASVFFPQEFYEAMGLNVIIPENFSVRLATKQEAREYLKRADALGITNDLCSMARINMAYINDNGDNGELPVPDYLLCSNNMCDQTMKWFQTISKQYDAPLFLVDIPFVSTYDISKSEIDYIISQLYEIMDKLEIITGNVFSEEKLHEVMKISSYNGMLWGKIHDLLAEDPYLFRGTNLFAYMGIMVCERCRKSTTEALETLYNELLLACKKEKKQKKLQYINYEGIACWPNSDKIAISTQKNKLNITSTIYTRQFAKVYEDLEGMIKAYVYAPNAVCLEHAVDLRLLDMEKSHSQGMLMHMSRTCKRWSGTMLELKNQIENQTGRPVVIFDGDQGDKQSFSEAQYDTRLQGFKELIEEEK